MIWASVEFAEILIGLCVSVVKMRVHPVDVALSTVGDAEKAFSGDFVPEEGAGRVNERTTAFGFGFGFGPDRAECLGCQAGALSVGFPKRPKFLESDKQK